MRILNLCRALLFLYNLFNFDYLLLPFHSLFEHRHTQSSFELCETHQLYNGRGIRPDHSHRIHRRVGIQAPIISKTPRDHRIPAPVPRLRPAVAEPPLSEPCRHTRPDPLLQLCARHLRAAGHRGDWARESRPDGSGRCPG